MDQLTTDTPVSRRPRVMRNERQWGELLAQFNNSNLNVREFCKQHQLTPSSFHHWRKRLREVPSPKPAFVALDIPVAVDSAAVVPVAWDVELSLGAGVTLRLRHC